MTKEYYASARLDSNNFAYTSSHSAREDGVPEEAILPFLKGWGQMYEKDGYFVSILDENDVEVFVN